MALTDDLAIYALGHYMHESHPLRLDKLCLNTIQRRNPCNICQEVCPKGLDVSGKKPDWHGCINCNLCVSACPTEAIHESSTSFAALTSALDAPGELVVIGCERCQGRLDVRVPCLAALPWELIATTALSRRLVIKTHACRECPDQMPAENAPTRRECPDQESFERLKDGLRRLRGFFGKDEFSRRILSREPEGQRFSRSRGAERRHVFGSAISTISTSAGTALNPESVSMSHYRAMLLEALESIPEEKRPELGWLTLEEDGNCQGCEICVKICPHHAIELRVPGREEFQALREARKPQRRRVSRPKIKGGQQPEPEAEPLTEEQAQAAFEAALAQAAEDGVGQALIHDASACTQCGLCYMTCPNGNLGGWDTVRGRTIPALVEHEVSLSFCEKCGRVFRPEGEETKCKACSRVRFA